MKIEAEVFWVMTPCTVAVGYRRFGGSYFLRNVSRSRLESIRMNSFVYAL